MPSLQVPECHADLRKVLPEHVILAEVHQDGFRDLLCGPFIRTKDRTESSMSVGQCPLGGPFRNRCFREFSIHRVRVPATMQQATLEGVDHLIVSQAERPETGRCWVVHL